MLSFLSESSENFEETESIGGFGLGSKFNSFDDMFESVHDDLLSKNTDTMVDIVDLVRNEAKHKYYKDHLLAPIKEECELMIEDELQHPDEPGHEYGTHKNLYSQLDAMLDNCRGDLLNESTHVGQLLPIKAIDYPILIKQYLKLATKDIMQTEITKSPVIKKHIEQYWIIDKNDKTGKTKWKYPQCFFEEDTKKIFDAGKGLPIKSTPVDLPAYNYNIITNLTDSENPDQDHYTFDLQIRKVVVKADDEDVELTLNQPMRINLSDNQWLGGKIDVTVKKQDGTEVKVEDYIGGYADPKLQYVTLNSFNGNVKSVIFSGYLSNEYNKRHVTFDYTREEIEWKIEDGSRADASFTLEQLEDAKALLDVDLYKKTYNHMSDYMGQIEDNDVLDWLDEMFEVYKGIDVSPLDWDGFVTEDIFDCDSTSITTALPVEYISSMLKFKIDGIIADIADTAKLEGFTFVLYGNPRLIRLLKPEVKWVSESGNSSNGVVLDYSYGIMTSGDVKVQVVSTKKKNLKYDEDEKVFRGLRLIPFPTTDEQFTFKHYKYTTHIVTNQNSAYRDPDLEGGSQTYLMGVSRYTNKAIQAIQDDISIAGAEPYINFRK